MEACRSADAEAKSLHGPCDLWLGVHGGISPARGAPDGKSVQAVCTLSASIPSVGTKQLDARKSPDDGRPTRLLFSRADALRWQAQREGRLERSHGEVDGKLDADPRHRGRLLSAGERSKAGLTPGILNLRHQPQLLTQAEGVWIYRPLFSCRARRGASWSVVIPRQRGGWIIGLEHRQPVRSHQTFSASWSPHAHTSRSAKVVAKLVGTSASLAAHGGFGFLLRRRCVQSTRRPPHFPGSRGPR